MQRRSITREEATEISTNSEFVQSIWGHVEAAKAINRCEIEAVYLNTTKIHELREGNPRYYDFMPYTHGVWRVKWEIGSVPEYGAATIIVLHFIDEKSGIILHEGGGAL